MRDPRCECPREREVIDAVRSGRWPVPCDRELSAHVDGCPVCEELAVVAAAFAAEADVEWSKAEPVLPAASLVWWRAQRRARQEALRKATWPVRAAQCVAAASAAGLAAAAGGSAREWLAGHLAWVAERLPDAPPLTGTGVLDLPPPVQAALVLAAVAICVLAPAALYLGLADE
jgi:hypothetical protein